MLDSMLALLRPNQAESRVLFWSESKSEPDASVRELLRDFLYAGEFRTLAILAILHETFK